jgi:hypothetical protein
MGSRGQFYGRGREKIDCAKTASDAVFEVGQELLAVGKAIRAEVQNRRLSDSPALNCNPAARPFHLFHLSHTRIAE